MLNKFLVAGRLTADPEMQTIGENRLCKFTIACDRPKCKGEDKPETDFFNCVAWNRNGDTVASWFKKGKGRSETLCNRGESRGDTLFG